MAISETTDEKNGHSPGAGHDEWWERLMMEPGPGGSAGTDASVTESMIPSGLVAKEVSGEVRREGTPPESGDPVRRRTSGRQHRASLEEYRETYLIVPKIRNRKAAFISENMRDRLDAVVHRLGRRGMSVSGLLESLVREHLTVCHEDIEQRRKIWQPVTGRGVYPMYVLFPIYPLQCGECGGGIFLWGEQGYVSGSPKTLAPRARRLLGGQVRSRRS